MDRLLAFLLHVDRACFYVINVSMANGFFDLLMPWITNVNHWWFLLAAGWGYLFWRGDRRIRLFALSLLFALLLANLLSSEWLKPLVHRLRPCKTLDGFRLLGHCGGRFGFPSSHAANTAAPGTILARLFPQWRWGILLMVLLVGFSRIYVGVHYPGDVTAGLLLGWLVGNLLWNFTRAWLNRNQT